MDVSRSLQHFMHYKLDALGDCLVYQHTLSLLVNGRVNPLGLDQVWPDIVHPNINF